MIFPTTSESYSTNLLKYFLTMVAQFAHGRSKGYDIAFHTCRVKVQVLLECMNDQFFSRKFRNTSMHKQHAMSSLIVRDHNTSLFFG